MRKYKFIGLMASDPTGVVGKEGKLPWHYPDELAHFRKTIAGHVAIMGRRTYDTIPKSTLATCRNFIFSQRVSQSDDPNTTFVASLEALLALPLAAAPEPNFVIGGGEVLSLFLNHNFLDGFLLSLIRKEYEGDTTISLGRLSGWPRHLINETETYSIYSYTNPFSPFYLP